jgi:predicted O-methyltransferase YrrM
LRNVRKFDAAGSLPAGSTVVEIGSHQGRSTVVLASALPPGGRLVAVDPFDATWRYGGASTRDHLLAHLAAAGVRDRVEIVATTSGEARASYYGPVDLLYVDGKHDYWTVRVDLRWADRVPDGGLLMMHDAFSSLGVTLALLRTLPASGGSRTPDAPARWPGSRRGGRRPPSARVPCGRFPGGCGTSW